MGKKVIIGSLLVASMLAEQYKIGDYHALNQKQLDGSAIYIPKRHKFKRKNKR